jgi:DNA-binding response OmpR family regulator
VRILIIEDEPKVGRAIAEGLREEGYSTTVARTGEDGFFLSSAERFDAILLDRMLPGREGLEILRALRGRGDRTPVICITARDSVPDRVEGLEGGADDYLVKPFAFPELLARVRAVTRRGGVDRSTRLSLLDLEVDLLTRDVTRAGAAVDLTPREFELLEFLLRHAGQVVSREMLARDVWKEPVRATPIDNVIDVHMTRLRRKIEGPGRPRILHTVRGVGFVLRPEE